MTGKTRGGLGRGLAALIPTGPTTTTVADVLINGAPAKREMPPLSLVTESVDRTGANGRPDEQSEVASQASA